MTEAEIEARQAKHRAAGNVIELHWIDCPDESPHGGLYLLAIRDRGMLCAVVNRGSRPRNRASAVREALGRSWAYEGQRDASRFG